jgi:hypothetical protein
MDADRIGDVLEAVLDRIIPADALGPGAAALGVGEYVRRALDGPYAAHRPAYVAALGALGARGFTALDSAGRDRLLAALEQDDPAFFALLRAHAVEGLLGDPSHGGNRDGAGWALIGYPGPRREQSAADQALR